MKRRSTAVALMMIAAALCASAMAEEKKVASVWQAGPMTIDGVAQEWETSEPIIDETSQVQYALRNDGRNLYIIMVFRSPQPGSGSRAYPKSTLDYTGMKIYFTTAAKKSKDFGILFQKKQYTADALIANMEKRGQVVSEAEKAEIRKKPTHIVFTEEILKPDKAEAPAGGAEGSDPPTFRAIDKGALGIYEFRIPLNRVAALGGIGAEPGQEILLGFDWGGMTNQILRDMMAGRADSSVRAADQGSAIQAGTADSMAGGEGGEIRGMGSGTGDMRRDPRYKKYTFWITAKLATEAN
jgi:hypothetical protein